MIKHLDDRVRIHAPDTSTDPTSTDSSSTDPTNPSSSDKQAATATAKLPRAFLKVIQAHGCLCRDCFPDYHTEIVNSASTTAMRASIDSMMLPNQNKQGTDRTELEAKRLQRWQSTA